MRNRRRRVSTGGTAAVAGQLMALSLFIMLLAFFIILNTISDYEESSARNIMRSLESVFAANLTDPDIELPSTVSSEDPSTEEGDVLDKLESLFSAQIPSNQIKVDKSEGVMYASVSYDDFSSAVMGLGKNAGEEKPGWKKDFFLPALVALLKNDQTGHPYRMDIYINVGGNPARMKNKDPQRLSASMKNAGRLAEKIESAGLQTKLLSMGVKKGDPETVEMVFRPHVAFNPVEDGHERGE